MPTEHHDNDEDRERRELIDVLKRLDSEINEVLLEIHFLQSTLEDLKQQRERFQEELDQYNNDVDDGGRDHGDEAA